MIKQKIAAAFLATALISGQAAHADSPESAGPKITVEDLERIQLECAKIGINQQILSIAINAQGLPEETVSKGREALVRAEANLLACDILEKYPEYVLDTGEPG